MRSDKEIREEMDKLETLHRSGALDRMQQARVCASLDTLRWIRSERAILEPSRVSMFK